MKLVGPTQNCLTQRDIERYKFSFISRHRACTGVVGPTCLISVGTQKHNVWQVSGWTWWNSEDIICIAFWSHMVFILKKPHVETFDAFKFGWIADSIGTISSKIYKFDFDKAAGWAIKSMDWQTNPFLYAPISLESMQNFKIWCKENLAVAIFPNLCPLLCFMELWMSTQWVGGQTHWC